MATPFSFLPTSNPYLKGLMSGMQARSAAPVVRTPEEERTIKQEEALRTLSKRFGGNNVVTADNAQRFRDMAIQQDAMRESRLEGAKRDVNEMRALQEFQAAEAALNAPVREIGGRRFAFDKNGQPIGFSGGQTAPGMDAIPRAGFSRTEQAKFDKSVKDALLASLLKTPPSQVVADEEDLPPATGQGIAVSAPAVAPVSPSAAAPMASVNRGAMLAPKAKPAPGPLTPDFSDPEYLNAPFRKVMARRDTPEQAVDQSLRRAMDRAKLRENVLEATKIGEEQKKLRDLVGQLEDYIKTGRNYNQEPVDRVKLAKQRDGLNKKIKELEAKRIAKEQGK